MERMRDLGTFYLLHMPSSIHALYIPEHEIEEAREFERVEKMKKVTRRASAMERAFQVICILVMLFVPD